MKLSPRQRLVCVLLAAAALRLGMAFGSLGPDHPNETYRLLEPLAARAGYAARLPWEWVQGLLSPLPVAAHGFFLFVVGVFGVESALAQLIALKVLYAALSLLPIWATWRLLEERSPRLALVGAASIAFWPEFVFRSVRLMDYSLEAATLAGALILAFTLPARAARLGTVAAGAVLGTLFFARFQSGLYLVAVVIALRWERDRAGAARVLGGYTAVIALLGLAEMAGTGRGFLAPFFAYLRFNAIEGGAAIFYGVAPWHRYLSEGAKALGFAPFVLLVGAAFSGWRSGRTDRRLALVFFLPLLTHSLVGHKEGRFVYGFLWTLIPLGLGAWPVTDRAPGRWCAGAAVLAVVAGVIINLQRIAPRIMHGNEDVRQWAALRFPEPASRTALMIEADPDAVPGGFLLRYPGPGLCYTRDAVRQAPCPPSPLRLTNSHGLWGIAK